MLAGLKADPAQASKLKAAVAGDGGNHSATVSISRTNERPRCACRPAAPSLVVRLPQDIAPICRRGDLALDQRHANLNPAIGQPHTLHGVVRAASALDL